MRSHEQQAESQIRLTTAALCCCGALIGGIAGLLAGLGTIAVPGVGPVVATFPLTVAVGGSGIGAAIGGTIGVLNAWEVRMSRTGPQDSQFADDVPRAKGKAAGA